jgi:ATP-binding cassette subfamily B protein/subfamily B ATP-binding cassette protein MsbA
MLLSIGFTVLTPWPLKLIVDNVLPGKPLPDAVSWMVFLPGANSPGILLAWLAFSTLMLFLLRRAVLIIKSFLQVGASTRMKLDVAGDLFFRLQLLSTRFHSKQKVGDLVRRVVNDTDFIEMLIAGVVLPALTSTLTLFVMFWVMWKINPFLSLIALIAAVPMPILMTWLTPRMSELSYEHYQAKGVLMSVAEQSISSLPVVQAFGRESDEEKRFRGSSRQAITKYLLTLRAKLQFTLSVGTVTALGTAAMIVFGGLEVQAGQLSIGSLLVFLSYLAAIYGPLEALANLSAAYANCEGQARRIMQVLESKDNVPDSETGGIFVPQAGRHGITVSFENISFGYESDRIVLDGIDLTVEAGQTVALVGATGVGKTTLASLVSRFFDPWKGRVLFDGIDIREFQLNSVRQQVALVLQDPFLLPLTVAENIAYGRPDAKYEEIVAAATAANADEFIIDLPKGYNTVIGERGDTLSGGQCQRLAIARALLKDAPILILDEPTSALDAKTEAQILEALERLMTGRTTIIIAHRLSTIRHADRIIVLKDGAIVEQGSHVELIAQSGVYANLVKLSEEEETK